MINKNDLVCGTLIAPNGLHYSKTSILTNLEEMFHLTGDPLSFRDQAVEQSQTPEFISLVDEVAGCIGDELVASVGRIKEHVIPVLKEISEKVNESFSMGRVLEQTVSGLTIQYACVDSPFFDSPLFPTGRKSKGLSFSEYSLRKSFPDDMLEEVSLTPELVNPFVVDHPDINRLLDDHEDYVEAIKNLHSREWWGKHFSETGEYCNFTKVTSFKLNELFRVYIVLSKIRATDELLIPVQHVSLENYKIMINELWEGMNVYLSSLKIMCENYRLDGLVIRNKSKFELVKNVFNGVTVDVLRGDCDVLFSQAYAEHIDTHNSSLAEVVYNYILHSIESGGRPKVSAMAFVGLNSGSWSAQDPLRGLLCKNVEHHRTRLSELINSISRNCLQRKLTEMGVVNPDLSKLHEDLYAAGGNVSGLDVDDFDVTNIVMSSGIGGRLLQLLGFKNAAELLRYTRQELLENKSNTRALSTAYAKFAVNYLTCENKTLEG